MQNLLQKYQTLIDIFMKKINCSDFPLKTLTKIVLNLKLTFINSNISVIKN